MIKHIKGFFASKHEILQCVSYDGCDLRGIKLNLELNGYFISFNRLASKLLKLEIDGAIDIDYWPTGRRLKYTRL